MPVLDRRMFSLTTSLMPVPDSYGGFWVSSPCRAFRMRTLIRRRRIAKQQHHAAALDDTWTDFSAYSISLENHFRKMGDVGCRCSRSRLFGTAKHQPLLTF